MSEYCPFEVTPLAQVTAARSYSNVSLNYLNQDFWSLKARMIEMLKQHFDKDFNDFTESSLALMLIEMWAFLADTLSFKIDQLANEIFIDTVTELQNAIRLARLIGYKATPPLPARAMFVATINHSLQVDLPIQTPVMVSYQSPDGTERVFELYPADMHNNPLMGQPIIIPAGSMNTTSIVGIDGRTYKTRITGTGLPWQRLPLSGSRILLRSIRVTVDGMPWEEVEFFTDASPRREFIVEYATDYSATIFFGNGKMGFMPQKGSAVDISYRSGGGEDGNVVTGSIEQTITLQSAGLSYTVAVAVKNYTRGEGGYDGDTIEDIRRKLPLYIKTQNRGVTGLDYKLICDNFASATNGLIGKSTLALRNHGCGGNIIDIFVLARDGNNLIEANVNLKNELLVELSKKKMFTDLICIKNGTIIYVDVHVEILMDKNQKRFESGIRERIERRIFDFLSIQNWEYGQLLRENDIIKILADVKEAEQIEVVFTTAKGLEIGQGHSSAVSVRYDEIIRPDNISVNFSYKVAE